jgi:hypothetical protein
VRQLDLEGINGCGQRHGTQYTRTRTRGIIEG